MKRALSRAAVSVGTLAIGSAALIVLAACSPTRPSAAPTANPSPGGVAEAPGAPLAGSSWRLVEIQSMDDAIGTTKPDDPSLYTLAFDREGRVAMRLNCNRGIGSYKATPGPDGASGSLAIGPLAVTRALCPPPSLDERIARDMDFVRGYLLRDGRLALSLEADAAIYLWEPAPSAEAGAATNPDR